MNVAQILGMPKWWRPKMPTEQSITAKIVHWDLLDRITKGQATYEDMWSWMETGYTNTKLMQLLHADGVEFSDESTQALVDQLEIYASVAERFKKTGRVGFSGPELLIARAACFVMDDLMDRDRHGCAARAAVWSFKLMEEIKCSHYKT